MGRLHVQNKCRQNHFANELPGTATGLIIAPSMVRGANHQNCVFVQKYERLYFSVKGLNLNTKSYLHIQTTTPAGQMPGLHSNSAGLSASCKKGLLTQSGIQGLDPEPESPAASGGRTPSGGAVLQDESN